METFELEEEIRSALINNAALMAVLPNGAKAVYHYAAPTTDPKNYPIIVYSPISDVPALSGDDSEIVHRVTIKIHVITKERTTKSVKENLKTVYQLVKETMTSLNFVRRQTISNVEDGKLITVFEFAKNILC